MAEQSAASAAPQGCPVYASVLGRDQTGDFGVVLPTDLSKRANREPLRRFAEKRAYVMQIRARLQIRVRFARFGMAAFPRPAWRFPLRWLADLQK
jgi:hypothetical protein